MSSLLSFFALFIFQTVSIHAQPPSLDQESPCDWSSVSVNSATPYESCINQRSTMEPFTQRCVDEMRNPKFFKKAIQLAMLQQYKLIFNLELFYLSRIPFHSALFEPAWTAFQEEWQERLDQNADLMNADADPGLQNERCALHQLVGRDCGGQPGIDLIHLKKEEAIESTLLASAEFKEGPSLIRDLLKAELILEAAEPSAAVKARRPHLPVALKNKQSEKEILAQNYIESYYPEFHFNSNLRYWLRHWLVISGAKAKLDQELNAREAKRDLEVSEKITLVKEISLGYFQHFQTRSLEKKIEDGFHSAFADLMQQLNRQLDESTKSPSSVLDEDYLLGSAMQVELNQGHFTQASFLQALICKNAYTSSEEKQFESTALLVGGGLALFTGVGALFDAGISTVLSVTSLALVNAMSGYEVFAAYQEQVEKQRLYVLKGIDSSELSQAEKNYLQSIPWAILNAVLSTPLLVLKEIEAAKTLAVSSRNLSRVARLDFYRKAVMGATIAINESLNLSNVKNGYDATLELLKNAKKPAKEVMPKGQARDVGLSFSNLLNQ